MQLAADSCMISCLSWCQVASPGSSDLACTGAGHSTWRKLLPNGPTALHCSSVVSVSSVCVENTACTA